MQNVLIAQGAGFNDHQRNQMLAKRPLLISPPAKLGRYVATTGLIRTADSRVT